MIQFDIVITSIFHNKIFKNYYENFKKYNKLDLVRFIFVADLKTPKECFLEYQKFKKKGLNIIYLTIDDQIEFLKKINCKSFFPYNSDNRRNIGYLFSYSLNDSKYLISIDDDNFSRLDHDFIGRHSIVGKEIVYNVISSKNHWFNNCDTLKFNEKLTIFPRGFPLEERKDKFNYKISKKRKLKIGVNAGMWLNAPDIDAMTWLNLSPEAINIKKNKYVLAQNTWCPINSQNTCIIKEAIPTYFFLKMNYSINNQIIDRFGDIFSGYFLQICLKHMNYNIAYGVPLVDHNRNSHNYLKDAEREWNCLLICNKLLKDLIHFKLEGNNFFDLYESLISNISLSLDSKKYLEYEKKFLISSLKDMKYWLNLCKKINA